MWYVYVLQSFKNQSIYIGSTNSIRRRFVEHQKGFCISTRVNRPWKIRLVVCVTTYNRARRLEKYFKSGSCRVILKKRFLSD
ncbi:MAG: GIY-YIG nuclease family protein [Patescibacteria group bacterium]